MIARLRRLLLGSIRRQLILGIALVHAVLMTLFVLDLVQRQRDFLHRQTQERAASLARATAASATQWVLANDLVGMEELLQGLGSYPDLRYAMILAPDGRVLAHSQAGIAGRYIADPISLKLLDAAPEPHTLVDSAGTVDVAAPILRGQVGTGQAAIGWTRIGLGQDRQAASLSAVTREGLVYTLAAIVIGTLFAWFMARGLTRGLSTLRRVADAVREGRHDLRARLGRGDEIGHLGEGFDRMIDQLVDNEAHLRASREELALYQGHLENLVAQRTAALAESETRYRTVADFNSDWETWIDQNNRYSYVSPSCEAITGYRAEEFVADPELMLRILLPEDLARVGDHFRGAAEAGSPTTLEFRIRRRDGRNIWIEHVCRAVHDGDGRFLGRRASNRDITEHKRLAQDLALARDQAEAANRAKSQFLANMSHELRTPLNAILGFAQLMVRDPSLSPEHRRDLATINRSGHHLLDLINDVLEISRIEAGRTTLQKAPFDLDDSLRAIEEMTRVRADAKGLGFSVERGEGLPRYVLGDAPRLRQVLLNLLSNAVKYTDAGAVRLAIARNGPEWLRFEVGDSGPGIAAEEQERIFQAFYQTAGGAAKGEGSGLGLAISREYVRLMQGELRLRSREGEGSTFFFALPLPTVDGDLVGADLPRRVRRLRPGQTGLDVLVAEDNADNRDLLTRLLERVGFRVRAAVDGEAAIASFQERRPDFIWMDMRMPTLDGYETTRRIRALPGGNQVRIAALTASAFRENREEILAAGCDDMVAKPLDEPLLFEVMSRLLGVEYEYESTPAEPRRGNGVPASPPTLPVELAAELRRAAESLDVESSRALIARLASRDADTAATLDNLLDDFRFEDILRLLPPESGAAE